MSGENKDKDGVLNEKTLICGMCGSSNVETENKEHTFPYGVGKEQVELSATVPVRVCKSCGFQFTDYLGEEARHNAVCKHRARLKAARIMELEMELGALRAAASSLAGYAASIQVDEPLPLLWVERLVDYINAVMREAAPAYRFKIAADGKTIESYKLDTDSAQAQGQIDRQSQ